MDKTARVDFDYVIIGAGPGGLQLGYYFQQRGYDYAILEAGRAGSFFRTFPRHRKLISINKTSTGFDDPELNLRWDWNSLLGDARSPRFASYSQRYFPHADDMVRYLGDYAEVAGLNIVGGASIVSVRRPHDRFLVQSADGREFSARRLIVATGLSAPVSPVFSGSEHVELYGRASVDPKDYNGQRVMIIGKGNSGFETGDNLVETAAAIHMISPSPVRLAWRTHYVGHLRAVNNNLLDTYQLKSQNTILDAEIQRIRRVGTHLLVSIRYTHAQGEEREIAVDRVIACCGFRFDASPFSEECRPRIVFGKYPEMNCAWEALNVPDMFFAGTLMHMRDYRRSFSGFIHGFRYNVKILADIIAVRYHGAAWYGRAIPSASDAIVRTLIERIHSNSSLFQQPGFIADVATFDGDGARYYEDMPFDLVEQSGVANGGLRLTLTMEYGHQDYVDPFNIPREPAAGERSHFIHPVLRVFRGDAKQDEYHVPEDLENDWRHERYVRPLADFVAQRLEAAAPSRPLA